MDEKEYTFVAMRDGEIVEEPDLRRYPGDWFDTLHFTNHDGDARLVVFPAMGAWAINGKLFRLSVGGRSLLERAPVGMRQYKSARSYFVGVESFDLLREFHLEAEFEDPAHGGLRVGLGYSFETGDFFFKLLPLDTWSGEVAVTYGDRDMLRADLKQAMAGLLT